MKNVQQQKIHMYKLLLIGPKMHYLEGRLVALYFIDDKLDTKQVKW
jgi:hypothetical protein